MHIVGRLLLIGAASFVAIGALVTAFVILTLGAALLGLALDLLQAFAAWITS